MNRFEQTERSFHHSFAAFFFPTMGFVILLLFFLNGIHSVNDTTLTKQQESLEQALMRCISHCYAVEGAYPSSLEYLITNYGLSYNTDIFLIDYEYYGDNLLPDYTILRKQN